VVEAVKAGDMSVASAAKVAKQPKQQQAEIVKLPTAKEARQQARETGKTVRARDGKMYDGRTVAQDRATEAETKRIMQLPRGVPAGGDAGRL
jgi:hypothetical protein